MNQSRRKQIYSIDAKLYLWESYYSLQDELKSILEEEVIEFNHMPDGQLVSSRGAASRDAQVCLQRAIKALSKIVDGKRRRNFWTIFILI